MRRNVKIVKNCYLTRSDYWLWQHEPGRDHKKPAMDGRNFIEGQDVVLVGMNENARPTPLIVEHDGVLYYASKDLLVTA